MKFFILSLLIFYPMYGIDPLSQIAEIHKTDKAPSWHNYTPIYNFYFSEYREQPMKFLEVGFYHGASARMWQDYFSNAQLYFVDIKKSFFEVYGKGLSDRCHLHIADQSKSADLKKFLQNVGGDFDVIIDDGGHTMDQQLITFKELFPYLKDGGIYVIEDLHTSYWKSYGGNGTFEKPNAGPGTMIQFLKNLLDEVNFVGARTKKANKDACPQEIIQELSYYQKYIRSMHFYDSLCFIIKKEVISIAK